MTSIPIQAAEDRVEKLLQEHRSAQETLRMELQVLLFCFTRPCFIFPSSIAQREALVLCHCTQEAKDQAAKTDAGLLQTQLDEALLSIEQKEVQSALGFRV